MNDYYALLGVDRFVSPEALRHAYRTQILAMHPDHNPGNALASARAREIIEAYHVLSNPVARRDYDLGIGCQTTDLAAYRHRQPISFEWIPRLAFVMTFFAVLAGLVYGTVLAVDSRNVVFRPSLEAAIAAPDPASPVILGKRIPKLDTNVARDDQMKIASNIINHVCLQTAVYSQTRANPAVGFFSGVRTSL